MDAVADYGGLAAAQELVSISIVPRAWLSQSAQSSDGSLMRSRQKRKLEPRNLRPLFCPSSQTLNAPEQSCQTFCNDIRQGYPPS
jgi:hypothetical protein